MKLKQKLLLRIKVMDEEVEEITFSCEEWQKK
jgi:hypothetical protein